MKPPRTTTYPVLDWDNRDVLPSPLNAEIDVEQLWSNSHESQSAVYGN
jgi:hypothetical protein